MLRAPKKEALSRQVHWRSSSGIQNLPWHCISAPADTHAHNLLPSTEARRRSLINLYLNPPFPSSEHEQFSASLQPWILCESSAMPPPTPPMSGLRHNGYHEQTLKMFNTTFLPCLSIISLNLSRACCIFVCDGQGSVLQLHGEILC